MSAYDDAVAALQENAEQWQALEAAGHCVVLAGPGSGKTKTLTVKMARLLRDVAAPRGVACLTYSAECARELRRRLDVLGVEESERAFVGTLHGFCLRHILGTFGRLAGIDLPDPIRVANEAQRTTSIVRAMRRVNAGGNPTSLLHDVEKLRKDFIDRTTDAGWDEEGPLERLCVTYEDELTKAGLVDFDMIVLEALRIVELYPWLRRVLRARFPKIVVDEYQDLGPALHRLVLSLCFDAGATLYAVGDPDQSIYGFNGARPELLMELAARDDVESVKLRLNYRSGSRLVRASSSVLQEERAYESTRGDIGDIHIHACRGGIEGEVATLVESVLPDVLERMRPHEVLVLYPSKNEGTLLEDALRPAGIQFIRVGRDAAYPKAPLTRFLEECAAWCAATSEARRPRISRLIGRWIALLRLLDAPKRRTATRQLVRFLFDHRDGGLAVSGWLADFESAVMDADARFRLETSGEIESLIALRAAVAPEGKLCEFTVANLAGQVGSPDHLHLVTLHSSKGKEFRAVMIVGVDEGRVPSTYKTTPASIREARRLFYVGVTRAEDEVHIFASRGNESPFLTELQDYLAAQ